MRVRLALARAFPDCPRESAINKKGPLLAEPRWRQIVAMDNERLFLFVVGFVEGAHANLLSEQRISRVNVEEGAALELRSLFGRRLARNACAMRPRQRDLALKSCSQTRITPHPRVLSARSVN